MTMMNATFDRSIDELNSGTRRLVCLAAALLIVIAGLGAGSAGADAAYRTAQAGVTVQFG